MESHPPWQEGPRAPSLRVLLLSVMPVLGVCAGCSGPERAGPEHSPASLELSVDPAERALVVAAVQRVFDAINHADPDLLRDAMMPQARVVAVRPGRGPARSSVEEMASLVADPPQRFVERMWDAQVHIQGPIAAVWAPYDFYRDGEFSHCGVDAFHLVLVDGAWRIESLVYNTLQPPDCAVHPAGPPPPA